ncbi:hypothetical protein ECP02994831_3330 [Escherichia coli P0299483.1]|nr:hypothetical protein ECP02994831_3330 [Escherichia coli P0299483.1]END78198.1 hypothetical protein ECP02994832_3316 [Escherichia coli P0299483.2]END81394.1 hypothetical protein ECP02994833_3017 [Escherichia coli P0299483.3]KDW47341.1 hypothetical protein AC97_0142 [Escherichia coli 2-177-06_S4_C2]
MFPAPAGINRYKRGVYQYEFCVPRASGDKPASLEEQNRLIECSPRQRG